MDSDLHLMVGHPAITLLEQEHLDLADIVAQHEQLQADLSALDSRLQHNGSKVLLALLRNVLCSIAHNDDGSSDYDLSADASGYGGTGSLDRSSTTSLQRDAGSYSASPFSARSVGRDGRGSAATPTAFDFSTGGAKERKSRSGRGRNMNTRLAEEKMEELLIKVDTLEAELVAKEKEAARWKTDFGKEKQAREKDVEELRENWGSKMRRAEQQWREEKAQLLFRMSETEMDRGTGQMNLGAPGAVFSPVPEREQRELQEALHQYAEKEIARRDGRITELTAQKTAAKTLISDLLAKERTHELRELFLVWKGFAETMTERKHRSSICDEQWKLAVAHVIQTEGNSNYSKAVTALSAVVLAVGVFVALVLLLAAGGQ